MYEKSLSALDEYKREKTYKCKNPKCQKEIEIDIISDYQFCPACLNIINDMTSQYDLDSETHMASLDVMDIFYS